MPGIDLKGDGARLYFAVVKEDETPKRVEVFMSVEGNTALGSTSTSLPNRRTIVRTNKQEVLDSFEQMGGVVYDENVVIPD